MDAAVLAATVAAAEYKSMGVGGLTLPGAAVDPLEKCQNGAEGSVSDNLQLNNSLTHSNFRYFVFFEKNIKILEKLDPPWEKVYFFLDCCPHSALSLTRTLLIYWKKLARV